MGKSHKKYMAGMLKQIPILLITAIVSPLLVHSLGHTGGHSSHESSHEDHHVPDTHEQTHGTHAKKEHFNLEDHRKYSLTREKKAEENHEHDHTEIEEEERELHLVNRKYLRQDGDYRNNKYLPPLVTNCIISV